MRQIVHSFRTGAIEVVDVPRPRAAAGDLVIANEASVVSSGTERMLVSFGAAGIVGKLQREPARAQQVLHKALTDGPAATLEAVRAKLEEPTPLGYSSAGIVIEAGEGVEGFRVGERVATSGPHAEVVRVSADRAALVPEGVSAEDAAFTAIASVALRALQEAEVVPGDVVAVLGFGVIGRLAARLARAMGCRVLGFDPDSERAASEPGIDATDSADTFAAIVARATSGAGVAAVLIAADVGDRSRSHDPIAHAEALARFRGRIVLIGAGDPTLDRRQFYAKELRFSVSHSYGGRSEFEAVLAMIADGRLDVASLSTATYGLERAHEAYADLRSGRSGALSFHYDRRVDASNTVRSSAAVKDDRDVVGVGVIGAGNYARRVLLPALAGGRVAQRVIASRGGLDAALVGRQFGFACSTTDVDAVLADESVDAVFVLTRHDAHAELAARALRSGKSVWVEKPVALRPAGLDELEDAWRKRPAGTIAMAGFNRRFAPVIGELSSRLSDGPLNIVYQVHAGALPPDHWLLDPAVGGGRFVGEAVHFVDLARFLVGRPLVELTAALVDAQSGTLTARFADGSVATIQYVANRSPRLAKERVEVFDAGIVYRVENFRTLEVFGAARSPVDVLRRRASALFARQDKGHAAAVQAFVEAVRTHAPSPVPFNETIEVTRLLFHALGAR